jgi:surface protein
MDTMFANATSFNNPIGEWDTSKVTTMASMFNGAAAFNQTISSWDTSKVTTMYSMFSGAAAFNQNIIGWNVSNVVTQPPTNFITGATIFDSIKQPIWITLDGNGTTIKYSGGLILAIPTFVQAKPRGSGSGLEWFAIVTNDASAKTMITNYAKNDASAIELFKPPGPASSVPVPFNNIITSLITDMSSLFSSASAFNQPVGSWDTSNVTAMASMFSNASAFNQPISSWNTSNVTTMVSMFNGAAAFNQYITNWNVNNVSLFNTFKQSSGLGDPNTPTKFLYPPTFSFPIGRIPITPIFYNNVVNKVVTITRPVSNSSGGFAYTASVKTVKLDATNYSNDISGVTVSTDGNQDCTLTIPKNNTSFINRIGLIATQSSSPYYNQGSVEYPINIDVINTASDQVFLHSTNFNVINAPSSRSTGYSWMACLGEVQSTSSILGFSFQCFGSFSNPINQTIKVTVSVSNPTSAWENAVSTEAETTIIFTISAGSGMDGRMTFIPFSPSLLSNNPSYVSNITNITYSPPGGLNSTITSYLSTLQPGCYLKMSFQRIDPVLAFGEYWGDINISNTGVYNTYYITGSLVIFNQNANNAGELSSPQTTPNPNDLPYTASCIVFSDTFSNMISRMGVSSWNSLMFYYVRINPIEFTNSNLGYPQYPMDLKLQLTIYGLDVGTASYMLYYIIVEFQVQAAYVFSSPLNIHFNMPAPGTKGSIDMKETYGYYIKTCRGFGNDITIVWGINGIGSITRNSTNTNMLIVSPSYPFVNKQIRVVFNGYNSDQKTNTSILNSKVDIALSTTNNQNQFRPQNAGWAYGAVALKGW